MGGTLWEDDRGARGEDDGEEERQRESILWEMATKNAASLVSMEAYAGMLCE